MTRPTKEDWHDWMLERQRFRSQDTQGFIKDLAALARHIRKLQEVCPKDKAGWPVGTALSAIKRLQDDYARFTAYFDSLR